MEYLKTVACLNANSEILEYDNVMKQMKIMSSIPDQGYFDRDFEQMFVDFLQNFDKMNVTNTWLQS